MIDDPVFKQTPVKQKCIDINDELLLILIEKLHNDSQVGITRLETRTSPLKY